MDPHLEDLLEQNLTTIDLEELKNVRYLLSQRVRWGKFAERIQGELLAELERIVFHPSKESSSTPYDTLQLRERALINGAGEKSKMGRDYLLLLLLRKTLGILKTKVRENLQSIPMISEEEEEELRSLLEEQEEESEAMPSQQTQTPTGDPDHENCPHTKTAMYRIKAAKTKSLCDELHQVCKRCGFVLKLQVLSDEFESRSSSPASSWKKIPPSPQECQHPRVQWKPGEEGKVALCSNKECGIVIDNPEEVDWRAAGLEPFGDNPQEDEMIVLSNGLEAQA